MPKLSTLRAVLVAIGVCLSAMGIALADEADELKRGMAAIAAGDYAAAVPVYKAMADHGDAFAQFTMGQLTEGGNGTPKKRTGYPLNSEPR